MLEELNGKLQDLSRTLVGLHVKDIFKKSKDGLKLRDLSEDEKEKIRKLFHDLESQVNNFVSNLKEKEMNKEMEEAAKKKTRTTLRDRLRKKK